MQGCQIFAKQITFGRLCSDVIVCACNCWRLAEYAVMSYVQLLAIGQVCSDVMLVIVGDWPSMQ